MKNVNYKITILFFFLLAFLNSSIAQENDPKNLTPPDGKAIVYIVRPTAAGGAIKFKVSCDDNSIGYTKGKKFIYVILEPGEHTFLSKGGNESELKINVEANKEYYIKQKVKMGALKANNELILLSETDGKEDLMKCKLAKKK